VMAAEKITVALKVITAFGIGLASAGLLVAFYLVNGKYFESRKKRGVEIAGEDFQTGLFFWVENAIKYKKN
ncbi:MAG: hypothetical protein K2N32_02125, partial [Clostridia bacterium]|nr:hypothetical protein [Clostridia bacterium]